MSLPNAGSVNQASAAGVAADSSAPAANTAAVVTYAAGAAGVKHTVSGLYWSYSAAPTGGNLQITDGTNTYFTLDITTSGAGFLPFSPPLSLPTATQMIVTLAAGGGGISGKVNVRHYTEGPQP